MKRINKAQVKKIRTVASRVFADDAEYHDWLKLNYGIKSTLDLGYYEAIEAINLLEGNTSFVARRRKNRVDFRISRPQAIRISILEKLLGWEADPARLIKFVDRQVKEPGRNIEDLTKSEARKVIIGLQRILSRNSRDVYDWLNGMRNEDLQAHSETIKAIYSDNPESLMMQMQKQTVMAGHCAG